MAQLSDVIEQFIKDMLDEDAQIELRRNELAEHFGCAPSQINYVLATRFTLNHGYIIESRRGGGGYVRVVRIQLESDNDLLSLLRQRIGTAITESDALAIVIRIKDEGLITQNEAKIMASAVREKALAVPVGGKNVLRAAVLQEMVTQVFKNNENGKAIGGK